jgi:putative PIN family toxin of toxin-antitoxin system
MVFLQAASRPSGPAARLFLEFIETGQLTLYLSDAILAEIHDVLNRPRIRAKNPTLTDERAEDILHRIEQVAVKIIDVPSLFPLPRDPDDEPYLNLALAANCKYLATWDDDLLHLMQDQSFRTQHPDLTILSPVALLQLLVSHPK